MASAGARRYQSIQQDGMQSNGTGPASRQLQDKVGGVMPAGLFLLIVACSGRHGRWQIP
jgi:hypothetical protein